MNKQANNPPLISVLVPLYNVEMWIEECVDSILTQTYPFFELLLVDDGSTDGSLQLCESYAERDSRIRVIHCSNAGIAARRNTAVQEARGEYIAWVDADDRVVPEYLETLLDLCVRYHSPLSACNHFIWKQGNTKSCFPENEQERTLTIKECCEGVLYHGIPDVSVWGKLFHRSIMKQITFPNGLLYEDTYVIADVLTLAGGLAYTPTPLYFYRIRSDSISRDVYNPTKMQFLTATNRMCERILTKYPEMKAGVIRRCVHASLSVRRYFVDCPPNLRPQKEMLEKNIRKNAWNVLFNQRAPFRDKIAILAVLCNSHAYDLLWKIYCRNS